MTEECSNNGPTGKRARPNSNASCNLSEIQHPNNTHVLGNQASTQIQYSQLSNPFAHLSTAQSITAPPASGIKVVKSGASAIIPVVPKNTFYSDQLKKTDAYPVDKQNKKDTTKNSYSNVLMRENGANGQYQSGKFVQKNKL